ncbi:hypothetical protein [Acidovorax sp. LjRoot117]|uniref:hypothetical protein n=1 Tax=Acidovorax sp. LjRoot117 TaxID=3342255 RepID=UPI003ED0DE35
MAWAGRVTQALERRRALAALWQALKKRLICLQQGIERTDVALTLRRRVPRVFAAWWMGNIRGCSFTVRRCSGFAIP